MSDTNTNAIGKNDVNQALRDSLNASMNALEKHDYRDGQDSKKLFGIIEVDSAIAASVEGFYNAFIGSASKFITDKSYGTVQHYGGKFLKGATLNRTAAGVAFAANAGVYAFPSLAEIYSTWNKQHDEQKRLVDQLAPVLDEMKGSHGIGAYNSVTVDQNQMIVAHRWRMAKINHTNLTNQILPTLITIAPNLYFHQRDNMRAMMTGGHLNAVKEERILRHVVKHHAKDIADEHNNPTHTIGSDGKAPKKMLASDVTYEFVRDNKDAEHLGIPGMRRKAEEHFEDQQGLSAASGKVGMLISGVLPTFVNKWIESSHRRLQKSFSCPYTALEMVLSLQDQLGNDPKPTSFEMPGGRGRPLPLQAYIAQVMIQHQRDMGDMNPEYAHIRDALKENVLAAAKPLAEALERGDIGPLSLIEYIGGGKIIRNKGRVIATAEEVSAMIEHDAGKHVLHTQAAIDPKDFWAGAPYNEKEGKATFDALQGEERLLAITFVPREVRKQFGISDKESKQADAIHHKHVEQALAEAILGVNALDDKALQQKGLASAEIRQLRDAAEQVKERGHAAAHELKSNANHANGVDHLLLDVLVGSEVRGDKLHLGTLQAQGREQLKEAERNAEANADMGYAQKEERRRASSEGMEFARE